MTSNRLRIKVRVAVLLTAVYWLFMLVATHIPRQPGGWPTLPHFDKLLHFAGYAGLAFLLACVLRRMAQSTKALWVVLVIVAAYGVLDEAMQAFIPSRSADVLDWCADLVGAMAGIGIYALLANFFAQPIESSPGNATPQ